MDEDTDIAEIKKGRKRRIFLAILMLLLSVILLLQLGPVQQWVANRVTGYLSNKTNTTISSERARLSLSRGVVLNGVSILSQAKDTILVSRNLSIGFQKGLWSLRRQELSIEDVELEGAFIRIHTAFGEEESNLAKVLASLAGAPKQDNSTTKPLDLTIRTIGLQDCSLVVSDDNTGQRQVVSVLEAEIIIDSMDLLHKYVSIDMLRLVLPKIQIIKDSVGYDMTTTVAEVEEIIENRDEAIVTTTHSFHLQVDRIDIERGVFSYDDRTAPQASHDGLDYRHMEFSDLEVKVREVDYCEGGDLSLDLDRISFIDDKGLAVRRLSSQNIVVNQRQILLPDFLLETDRTSVQRNVAFKFRSMDAFSDFADKVFIEADLTDTRVALADLMHYVPSLERSPFFVQNRNRVARISGKYRGRINNLKGQDVEISIGKALQLAGNISTRNITDRSTALINLGLKELRTSMRSLQQLIPGFDLPANFRNLGSIQFRGRFDGYVKDFVAFGHLDTDLGSANMDMRLDVQDGPDKANYSGEIALQDFDLGGWSGNQDLGRITASSQVKDGRGLSLEYAKADLNALVKAFTYKGYLYENFEMIGFLAENQFKGLFSINQDDVAFEFDGIAAIEDNQVVLDFEAVIQEIDLVALNLSSQPYNFSGVLDINTVGNGINTFTGDVIASEILIAKADSLYGLDTVALSARMVTNGRSLSLYSEIAKGEVEGVFQLERIPEIVKKILKANYPHYTDQWQYDSAVDSIEQQIDFRLDISDSGNIFDLFGMPGFVIRGLQTKGRVSNAANSIDMDLLLGDLIINGNELHETHVNLSSIDDGGDLVLSIDNSSLGGRLLKTINLEANMISDSLSFEISTEEVADSLETVNIRGKLNPHPKGYSLNIDENEWKMLGRYWDFDASNSIVFGREYIDVSNFSLTDGDRTIKVIDINEKGLQVDFADFDFLLINSLINYDKIDFSGVGDLYLSVDNIFVKQPSGMLNLSVPDFRLNNTKYGSLEVTALKTSDDQLVKANVSILRDTMSIVVGANYDLSNKMVDVQGKLRYVPMSIFEMIIPKGISGTTGVAIADAHLHGPADDLKLDGVVNIVEASTTIDYLGAEFFIDDQTLLVTETIVDATNGEISDPQGNTAVLTGGLNHYLFKDFTLNLAIEAENAVMLNTTKQDNPDYYGVGKGKMRAEFSGDFDATDLQLTAEAGAGTELNIPVQSIASGYDESFIKFIDRTELLGQNERTPLENFRIKGMNIDMNLTLTPEAKVRIIFDEDLGDEIVGYGRGDLQIEVNRSGGFEIFGEYEIEQGEYLFTAFGVVAKSFEIDRGGLVKWTGDPINATLDIDGTYMVNASLETFITEYLFEDQLRDLARNTTPVALKMDLRGRLYEPVVNFDLDFPELTGELKAYADNKVRTLRENEIALNSQVVGLLAFQTFLPDNNIISNDVLGSSNFLQTAGVSTLSEFVSSQLSRLFTGLFEAALTDNGLIAGVDFDIGLIKNSSLLQQSTTGLAPDEIQVNFKNRFRFLNERLSLNLGGNYIAQSVVDNNSFFGVDFALEYYLTDDRKLKLRMYGRNDIDQFIVNGRQEQYGFGVGYRTEFGTLADFQEGLKQSIKTVIDE